MRRLIFIPLTLLAIGVGAATQAGEPPIPLKDGPGKGVAQANCGTCHSLDYIPMNSPFLDRAGWEAAVNKMIKVMGAPIAGDQLPQIVDYLVANYGKQQDAAPGRQSTQGR